MPVNTEFRFDPGQILSPALTSNLTRLDPVAFGASLTIAAGQAVAQKTSDGKMYPLNLVATDGTQTFKGFSEYPVTTDSSGNVYFYFSGTAAGINYFSPPSMGASIYSAGIFNPAKLSTAATGTNTAEVDTITPASPTTGDIYSITTANGDGVEVTIGATQTAAAAVTLLANAWNANPVLKALATTSGTSTLILTGAVAGQPLNLKTAVVGTGTAPLVITTPAVSAVTSEVDTFTPSTVTTGDVHTYTINFPNGSTYAVSATVGATATATAITTLLKAAWNADLTASAYATATGTTTFILTSLPVGNSMNVTAAVVGTGTIAKVVTTPAWGRNLADILPGCPGARVLSSGFWELP